MRYFILALLFATPTFAAELPSLRGQPLSSPSVNNDYQRDQSFRDAMDKSRSQPDPVYAPDPSYDHKTVYVPVERKEQPSMLNEGGLKKGW